MPLAPTCEELERLVAAVCTRGDTPYGLRIGPDNDGQGWAPVTDLVAQGSCFAVRTRREVLALDADHDRAVAGLRRLVSGLRRRGLEFVHLASGGVGREHVFVAVFSPRLRDALTSEARRSGIDVRDSSPIRPPGVTHRSGATPILLYPSTWGKAAEILEQRRQDNTVRLSPRLQSLIQHGDLEGRYRKPDGSTDTSAMVLGICHLARADGVDAQTIFDQLQNPAHVGGEGLRRRNRRRGRYDARWWFHHTWSKSGHGSNRPTTRAHGEVAAELENELSLFLAAQHRGQHGNSDVAVFTAMVRCAQAEGSRRAPMSVRVLAERSGKDVKTVRAALPRLVKAGVVSMVDPSHLDRAATWEVTRIVPTSPVRGTRGCENGGNLRVESGHDGFAHGALGVGAWRVLNALDAADGSNAIVLANEIGMHPGSVRRHLHRLQAAGLVVMHDGMWFRVRGDEVEMTYVLELVAEHRGTAGRRARRHRQFELERQRLREVLTSDDELMRRRMELALSRGARRYYAGIIAGKRAA